MMTAKQSKKTQAYRQSDPPYCASDLEAGFGYPSDGKAYKTYGFAEPSDRKPYPTYWHPSFSSGSSEGGNCRPPGKASEKQTPAFRPRTRTKKNSDLALTEPNSRMTTPQRLLENGLQRVASASRKAEVVRTADIQASAIMCCLIAIPANMPIGCFFLTNVHDDGD